MDPENIPSSESESVKDIFTRKGDLRLQRLEEIAAYLVRAYLKKARAGRTYGQFNFATIIIPYRYSSTDVDDCRDILAIKGWTLIGDIWDPSLWTLGRNAVTMSPCTPREKHRTWGGPF